MYKPNLKYTIQILMIKKIESDLKIIKNIWTSFFRIFYKPILIKEMLKMVRPEMNLSIFDKGKYFDQ